MTLHDLAGLVRRALPRTVYAKSAVRWPVEACWLNWLAGVDQLAGRLVVLVRGAFVWAGLLQIGLVRQPSFGI